MNEWIKRRRRKQHEYRMNFLRALAQGGSYIIDWDAVYKNSGLPKPLKSVSHPWQRDRSFDTSGVFVAA